MGEAPGSKSQECFSTRCGCGLTVFLTLGHWISLSRIQSPTTQTQCTKKKISRTSSNKQVAPREPRRGLAALRGGKTRRWRRRVKDPQGLSLPQLLDAQRAIQKGCVRTGGFTGQAAGPAGHLLLYTFLRGANLPSHLSSTLEDMPGGGAVSVLGVVGQPQIAAAYCLCWSRRTLGALLGLRSDF